MITIVLRSVQLWVPYRVGGSGRDVSDVVEVLSDRGRGRGRLGGGGAKRRDQVVVLVFGDAGLEIASLWTKKGSRSCENCSDWH